MPPEVWQQRADAYQQHMGDQLHELARRLGVDVDALERLRCGWDHQKSSWTFPERDSLGNVVGISTRLLVPQTNKLGKTVTKKMVWGSHHGLFYDPDGWDTGSGPVLLVEGASDTAAAMSMGLAVIGRPSNTGGVLDLTNLLRDIEPARQIIVVGENDQKPDGKNPGRTGAIQTAKALATALGRPVAWSMPPLPAKDTREFLQAHGKSSGSRYAASIMAAAESISGPQRGNAEPAAAPEGEARTLEEWRAETATHRQAMATTPGIHLDRSPTGSGKTYNTIESCKLVGSTLTVLPTHANCCERVEEMQQQGLKAVAYPELTEETCQRFSEASDVQRWGLSVGQTICRGCEFAKSCQFQQQSKAADQAKHRVATHERLRVSPTLAYGKKKQGEDRGRPVDAVVIDEMPGDVLAPLLTVPEADLTGVRTLAHSTAYAHYIERDDAQRDFAESLLAVLGRVDAACRDITAPGRHPVGLEDGTEPPEDWQWLLLKAIRKVGKGNCDPKALKLITLAATGGLTHLDIVTDITARNVKQPDGTTTEQQTLRHYLVGRFKPDIDDSTAVIALDATGRAEDIEAATGRPVTDHTPAGHLKPVQAVLQITDDITRETSPHKVAAHIVQLLVRLPDVQRLGIIGHKPHIEGGLNKKTGEKIPPVLDLLPASFRKRVAMVTYSGQGPDRASNDWHTTCDHLLVLGTPRPNPGDVRRWLVQHGLDEAAALPDGDWGSRPWLATDAESGQTVEVFGQGNRHPDWHRAHTAICRASLLQACGRGRALLPNGIPVTAISNEPTGFPVAPVGSGLPASVVSTVQSLERLAGQIRDEQDGLRTDIFPIEDSYSENVGSDLPASLCHSALIEDHGIGQRQAERRLQDAVACGVLTRPKRGWYGFPQAEGTQQPPPADVEQVAAAATVEEAEPISVTYTLPDSPAATTATVSAGICPSDPTPDDEMQAEYAPADADLTDADWQLLFDERSAIHEYDGDIDRDTADRLAAEAIFGKATAARISEQNPPPSLAAEAAGRFTGRLLPVPPDTPIFRDEPSATVQGCCTRCGHDRFVQRLIHGGRSVARDCARCDYFAGFLRWNPAGYDPRPDRCEPMTIHDATASTFQTAHGLPVIAGDIGPPDDPPPDRLPAAKKPIQHPCSVN